ncbi:TetR/AcrR family transcriptional regulator C-terminal domain-containing protein [Actinokineospora auranticolor]|uniref:Regulatory TetR family protein n=1 Tax=Actinokineospora auranticolor TaxID=155976 RepID=A0A2S6GCQ0_9PSEU|nr:TetR/AcrR family transcriptional regulator C-terminal domain-containing protein [Actinokineospora auranticolor]PPK62758.1 regulatory TetR family protein [Actinokineospora auranticolor]
MARRTRPVDTDPEGRPVRRALTRDYIVATALAVLDRDGVDGLSMRKLATELGVNPMAVYHHLPNKAALFDGVVEAVFSEFLAEDDLELRTGTWRDHLTAHLRRLRDVLRRHPNVLPVLATRPAHAPAMMEFGDRVIGLLSGSGFTEHDLLVIISSLRTYTIGQVLNEAAHPVGGAAPRAEDIAALMRRYPNLSKALDGGHDPDAQYALTVQCMLDGFENRMRKSGMDQADTGVAAGTRSARS